MFVGNPFAALERGHAAVPTSRLLRVEPVANKTGRSLIRSRTSKFGHDLPRLRDTRYKRSSTNTYDTLRDHTRLKSYLL
jgi:hypothetical protein